MRRDRQIMGWLVVAAAVAFVVVYGRLSLSRHARFGTQVFDFGIFDQGLWLLSRFEEPFVTLRGLHLFADHSSYILVLLAPLYWIWADARLLLVFTVTVVAAGGPMLYFAALRERVRPLLAAAVAIAYLLHPAAGWNAWDNFHPEVMALPLLLGAYLLCHRSRVWWAVALLGVALLVKEDAALVVAPLGAYLAWRWRRPAAGITVVGMSVAMFLLNFLVLLPRFSPTGELLYVGRYAQFGDSMGGALWGMISRPDLVAGELATWDRAGYLAGMLLPLGLSLLAPEVLAVAAPITLANLLSRHGYQHEIQYHYTVYLLAVVAMAAVVGARRVQERVPQSGRGALAGGVVLTGLLGSLITGPWTIGGRFDPWVGASHQPEVVAAALDAIPDGVPVAADWFLAVHLAHREDVYMFPNPFLEMNWAASGVPLPSSDQVQWVAVLPGVANGSEQVGSAVAAVRRSGEFEVVADTESLLLLRRK